MESLSELKGFLDLGGIFILAMVILRQISKKMELMADQNVKILTLLTILVKTQTRFNGVERVLNADGEKVVQKLNEAEAAELVPGGGNSKAGA